MMSTISHDLRQRQREPEWMDQPDIDPKLHNSALRSLARLNSWARSARLMWPEIHDVVDSRPDGMCRVLDVATGAGDVPLALCSLAAGQGLELQFTAIDISAQAITYAKKQAGESGDSIDFLQCDALRDEFPRAEYDIVTCSLFLHHLEDDQAVMLLRKMHAAASRLVIVCDLRRCSRGLWLTHVASHVLTRSPVVHADGPRSVRAAYTIEEANSLAQRAGWQDFQIKPVWPYRFVLSDYKE